MIETNELIVTRVTPRSVEVEVNGRTKNISWEDLRAHANPRNHRGVSTAEELAQVYRDVLRQAETQARKLKSLVVSVSTSTGEATWIAEIHYVSGEHAGMIAGVGYADGMDQPHRQLAEQEARDAADRLRKMGYSVTQKYSGI